MLFTFGHGQRIVALSQLRAAGSATSASLAAGRRTPTLPLRDVLAEGGASRLEAASVPGGGLFGYFFPGAAGLPESASAIDALDALGAAMAEPAASGDDAARDSTIPPVFTYWGQFIDHDVTANTDRDDATAKIDGDDLAPLDRQAVAASLFNLRKGALELDSVYGDGPAAGEPTHILETLIRDGAKLRKGDVSAAGGRPPLPADGLGDLPRLGRLIDLGLIAEADVPPQLRRPDSGFVRETAVIGDARNDENLVVAQLHLAFLRFHDAVVDWLATQPGAPGGEAALFERARRLVRWHHQWLVINEFLPTVCDPEVVEAVKADEAPLYRDFAARVGAPGPHGAHPLPLEFSAAAFRFGHSMVRAAYDYNRFFGRAEGGSTPLLDRAPFDLLLHFTGRGDEPLRDSEVLPENWIIEWDRFVDGSGAIAGRLARRIDAALAPPLGAMRNEVSQRPDGDPAKPGADALFRHLARRNLRRGYVLNIPTAQAVAAALQERGCMAGETLSEAELTSGPTGRAIRDGGFVAATPLWFYVLKEAEMRAGGNHLGPLGSRIVAETLIGLVVTDPASYWREPGTAPDGRWSPSDGAKPGGTRIGSIRDLLIAAGVHA